MSVGINVEGNQKNQEAALNAVLKLVTSSDNDEVKIAALEAIVAVSKAGPVTISNNVISMKPDANSEI